MTERHPATSVPSAGTLLLAAARRVRALRWLALALPAIALLFLFITTGCRGVNYGFHWDEQEWHLRPARAMVQSGVLLPHEYAYPGFDKLLVIGTAIPAGIEALAKPDRSPKSVQAAMVAAFDQPQFLLNARRVFIVVSSLAIVWVYGAGLALRMPWWAAFVAASGVGLSWQFAYHSRFTTTDCVLVQFASMTALFLALFERTRRARWLFYAAVASGLGTGTKYPGVFLLLPVLLSSVWSMPARGVFAHLWRGSLLCGVAFLAYLVTTPGTLIEPMVFIDRTAFISNYYRAANHGGYTVGPGWEHSRIAFTFLSLAYFSPYRTVALASFVCTLFGIGVWLRRDFRMAMVLLATPVCYLGIFCATYRLAIVRNYLFAGPFLSLFLARGVTELARYVPGRWPRLGLKALLVTVLFANAGWLIFAAESIRTVDRKAQVASAIDYVRKHQATRFALSPQVLAMAREQKLALPGNASGSTNATEIVFFAEAEGPAWWAWKVNDLGLLHAVFGPYDIDFDWYTSWAGLDRVVVLSTENGKQMGVPLARLVK